MGQQTSLTHVVMANLDTGELSTMVPVEIANMMQCSDGESFIPFESQDDIDNILTGKESLCTFHAQLVDEHWCAVINGTCSKTPKLPHILSPSMVNMLTEADDSTNLLVTTTQDTVRFELKAKTSVGAQNLKTILTQMGSIPMRVYLTKWNDPSHFLCDMLISPLDLLRSGTVELPTNTKVKYSVLTEPCRLTLGLQKEQA